MGTRSLVVFENSDGDEVCVVYRQYDGYPENRGKELANFLNGRALVNGFGLPVVKESNGIGDLIAQWIVYEKSEHGNGEHLVGGVYIMPPNTRDVGEEYIYTIQGRGDWFSLECWDVYQEEFIDIETYTE